MPYDINIPEGALSSADRLTLKDLLDSPSFQCFVVSKALSPLIVKLLNLAVASPQHGVDLLLLCIKCRQSLFVAPQLAFS